MDLENHTRNIWIVFGTLSGVGVIVAFIRTWAWFSKSGKDVIDLPVRICFSLYIVHFFFSTDNW